MKHQHVTQPGNVRISGTDHDKASPLSTALRAKGFIPLPRLWIHVDALPELKAITDRYRETVNQTRAEIAGSTQNLDPDYGPLPMASEQDAAWEAHRRARESQK